MGDRFSVTGSNNQVNARGSHGNANQVTVGSPPPAGGPADEAGRPGGSPAHALHAFADIIGYSQLSARLQKASQDYLATVLADGIADAGASPGLVARQEQGDALLLTFPAGTDAGRVLARMPSYLNDELLDRNQDMAPHARVRLRIAFALGASAPGGTGLVGQAPIAAARLANWLPFRRVMTESAQAQCGVIIDDHLHAEYVRQRFRPDIDPGEYVPARVRLEDKGFDAQAWVRILGYPGPQVATLLARS